MGIYMQVVDYMSHMSRRKRREGILISLFDPLTQEETNVRSRNSFGLYPGLLEGVTGSCAAVCHKAPLLNASRVNISKSLPVCCRKASSNAPLLTVLTAVIDKWVPLTA